MATTTTTPVPTGPPMTTTNPNSTPQSSYPSGSLYVGDLGPDVTEALLFEIFNQVGPVSSIRVCRDANTRRSLGYAYVNFHSVVDAERALDTLNFTAIKGRQCRIMWSQRNPATRKSPSSNIFIKNLDKSIDNKSLYDTFSAYGNILSSKVATDEGNNSKGYGFVHYETDEGAQNAINKVNGMLLNGRKVFVSNFVRRSERAGAEKTYTNVYVKNIPEEWDEAQFRQTFEKFGAITSIVLRMDEGGQSRGFGFVNYDSHECALRAVEEGNELVIGDKTLYVGRFQSKGERSAILTKQRDERRRERSERFKDLNLYVKNLDDDVDEDKLREWFGTFGELTSVVVMRDENSRSRGFGFVCFAESECASKALEEMNGKMLGQKPLYVNRAQRKDERRVLLETQFHPNVSGGQGVAMGNMFYSPSGHMPVAQAGMIYPQQMVNRRFPPGAQGHMRSPYMGAYMVKGTRGQGRGPHKRYPNPMHAQQKQPHPSQQQQQQQHQQHQQQPQMHPQAAAAMQQVPQVAPMVALQHAPPQDLARAVANASPEVQKQMLGERLFPLIQNEQPDLAAKITGMLLEMDVTEVLSLLESPTELRTKVQEALMVLQSHGE